MSRTCHKKMYSTGNVLPFFITSRAHAIAFAITQVRLLMIVDNYIKFPV